MKDQAAEATIAAVAQKVSASGGVAALFGGLTANEIAAFGGLGVAVAGLIVQLVFKLLDNRRKAEVHRLILSGKHTPPQGSDDE